jgi:GMP synthase-like glutamine amidotransferase
MRLAIALAGGRAIKITTRAPRDPKSIDGLLFGGGSDVFPKRYAGEPKQGYRYDLARDDMEASWAEAALKHDIPILGVCRGMQMLNVLGGGTLFADLRRFKRRNYPATFLERIFYRLPIRVAPASWLAEATQCPELCVNSIHSQAVDRLGVGFHVTAWDVDGRCRRSSTCEARFSWVFSSTRNFSSIAALPGGSLEASLKRREFMPRSSGPTRLRARRPAFRRAGTGGRRPWASENAALLRGGEEPFLGV